MMFSSLLLAAYVHADEAKSATIEHASFNPTSVPGWLVLSESFIKEKPAAERAGQLRKQGIEATPLDSRLLANLRPGWFVLVHGILKTKEAAAEMARALKLRGIDATFKESGAARSTDRLVRVWGQLDPKIIHPPSQLELQWADEAKEAVGDGESAWTDKDGWFVAWLRLPSGAKQIEAIPDMSRARLTKKEMRECSGFFKDRVFSDIGTGDIEIRATPVVDCCDR